MTAQIQELKNSITSFERLENAHCMNAYKEEFLNDRRTLILVSNASGNATTALHGFQYLTGEAIDANRNVYSPYDW